MAHLHFNTENSVTQYLFLCEHAGENQSIENCQRQTENIEKEQNRQERNGWRKNVKKVNKHLHFERACAVCIVCRIQLEHWILMLSAPVISMLFAHFIQKVRGFSINDWTRKAWLHSQWQQKYWLVGKGVSSEVAFFGWNVKQGLKDNQFLGRLKKNKQAAGVSGKILRKLAPKPENSCRSTKKSCFPPIYICFPVFFVNLPKNWLFFKPYLKFHPKMLLPWSRPCIKETSLGEQKWEYADSMRYGCRKFIWAEESNIN